MIERYRKDNRDHKQYGQNELIVGVEDRQANKIDEEDYQFGCDYVSENGADEKAFLAFEDGATGSTPVFYFERTADDGVLPTRWATKLETSQQHGAYRSFFLVLYHGWRVLESL